MNSPVERARRFFDSRGIFFRDVVTILTGTVASRIIVILTIPFLARIYSPAEFGALALFMTINSIVTSVACGRYEMALVLPQEDRDADHLLVACVLLATLASLLSGVVIWVWGDELAVFLGAAELGPWLWLTSFVIWSVTIFNVLRSWASRTGEFRGISRSTVGGTLVTVVVQLGLGFFRSLGAGGLIIGQAIGQVAHFMILLLASADSLRASLRQGLTRGRMMELLDRYRRFPIYDSSASLLNSCSRELPVLMLGAFFSATIVGYYAMGRRTLAMPMQVIGNSIAQVFFPKAKQELDKGRLHELTAKIVTRLSAAGMTPMLLVTVAAPELISVVLGATWEPASIYIQWISIWLLSVFITAPLIQLFSVLERQKERLVYQTVQMLGRILSLGYGGMQGDSVLAVSLFCISSALVHYTNCVWILHRAGVEPGETVKILLGELVKAVPFVAAVGLVKFVWPGNWPVIAAFTVALLAFAALRLKDIFKR